MARPAPSGDRIDTHFSKKRLLDNKTQPAKLWTFALESVLDQLAGEAPEKIVQLIEKNATLRKLMIEKIVRKPHPSPQLGDTDIIEVFRVEVDVGDATDATDVTHLHPGHHDGWCVTIGELPRRLRTALKHEFEMHASATEANDRERMAEHGELWCSMDGRICFSGTTNKKHKPGHTPLKWLEDAYLAVVEGSVAEDDVPGWEEVQGAKWDDVDLLDKFPFLQKDTLLWDAYDHNLNDSGESRIRDLVRNEFRSAFCSPNVVHSYVDEDNPPTVPVGAAWVRKPKMRVWMSIE